MPSLIIATKNKSKFQEIKQKFSPLKIKLIPLWSFKKNPKIVEDGKSFRENALKKAKIIAQKFNACVLADDSGLEVDFLKGAPGIYSSRFVKPPVTSSKLCKKLLFLLKNVLYKNRGASFRCLMVLFLPTGRSFVREGRIRGKIGFKMQGNHGFGYDPIFIIPKLKKTFAQLKTREKNKISHRAMALQKIKKVIEKEMNLG